MTLIIESLIIEVPDVALLILGASVVPLNIEPLVVGEPAVPPLIIEAPVVPLLSIEAPDVPHITEPLIVKAPVVPQLNVQDPVQHRAALTIE